MSHQSAIKNVAMRMVTSSIQVYDTYPPQIISLPQNLLIINLAACMMHGPSKAPILSRTMT